MQTELQGTAEGGSRVGARNLRLRRLSLGVGWWMTHIVIDDRRRPCRGEVRLCDAFGGFSLQDSLQWYRCSWTRDLHACSYAQEH